MEDLISVHLMMVSVFFENVFVILTACVIYV